VWMDKRGQRQKRMSDCRTPHVWHDQAVVVWQTHGVACWCARACVCVCVFAAMSSSGVQQTRRLLSVQCHRWAGSAHETTQDLSGNVVHLDCPRQTAVPLHLSHPGTDTLPRNTHEQVRVRPDKLGVVTQGVSGTPHTTRRLHSTSGLFKLPAHSLATSHSGVGVILANAQQVGSLALSHRTQSCC
jgi:hypothetical protein